MEWIDGWPLKKTVKKLIADNSDYSSLALAA